MKDTPPDTASGLESPRYIQQVIGEGLILAGGAAAILLQVAHPRVAKGVDNHSSFAYRPLNRLRITMTYIYCVIYGTPAEKSRIIDLVHRAHAPIKGVDYSADDPELQLWVAATLYAVGIELYEQVLGEIDEDRAEAIYREYATLAVSLRVSPEMWPQNREAFWTYWESQIASFEVCNEAKHVAHDLLYNARLPFYFRAVWPLARVMTAGMLPPRLREAYGLKNTKSWRGTYKLIMGVTKISYPMIPKFIRTYPHKFFLKDMRRMIARAGVKA